MNAPIKTGIQCQIVSRRRVKPILSCAFCRGRKLRCDRQSPCAACVRRDKPDECIYSCSEQERKDAVDYRPRTRGQQTRQRITRLENLVIEMAQNSCRPSSNNAMPSGVLNDNIPQRQEGNIIDDMGKLSLTDSHTIYTGSSHWVTILDDIRHLKDELSEEYPEEYSESNNTNPEPTLSNAGLMQGLTTTKSSLLSSAPCLPREQILAMMPPRKVVDRHVSQFFNDYEMGPFILHRQTFLAEYETFWGNPTNTSIMWIGLLFSGSVSAFLQQQDARSHGLSAVEVQNMLETYRCLTTHCLITGDYLCPGKYTIETLTLYYFVERNVNIDISVSNWILIGVIIRIALRMGLHRDPSHWPSIRPLQAEHRRRLWIILYQMDFFSSTQVGLPRIIKDSQCDTRPPAHLFSYDIGVEHDEIPPERLLTESTALLYIIQRDKIIRVTAEIYDVIEAGPPSPSTIATLSSKLQRAIDAIPAWLKFKPLEISIADNPLAILHGMFMDVLVQKAVYLLHRWSFMKGSSGEENAKSNDICINAALAILEHQRRMSEEVQPGGILFNIRWKSTMMLCFALSRFDNSHSGASDSYSLHRRHDIVEALTFAKALWEKEADQLTEARRAAKAIAAVLRQDSDKSSTPTLATLNGGLLHPSVNIGHAAGFLDRIPGEATQNYFDSFNYEQTMGLDPSFFAVETGNILEDFVSEQYHP
ncbi:fungal-specific transcription factor domain-containing protein [Daldinia vernicosa]|uniref:fungal-specific transcription factor domain-containing protein n=1 Tax=Daldinia vernicosa TaxID=114800 RepID=UPI002007FB85|nr:fungal-specific transcription factor domain-containing protein [Daldinia vernicosa]KAI0845724.1 fungal-specific transcription factor domain-containing protein [Daldinia vernicosa]